MLIVIDNYDSFTYNLVHALGGLGASAEVLRNDACSVESVMARKPAGLVISPGPGTPDQAGISLALTRHAAQADVPLLGVCLGHQTIAQAMGGRIVRCGEIVHGKAGVILHEGASVFSGLPSPFSATRYHSLVADPESLPPELEITARLENGTIMGLRHRHAPLHGVQFHPESIASQHGAALLGNFLKFVETTRKA